MNKKTALITGASSGIGKEIAFIHAQRGGDIVAVARSKKRLEKLKEEIESKYEVQVVALSKDLTDKSAPNEVYEFLRERNIEINYLINNAGFGGLGQFHERDLKEDLSMIQLNIVALTELARLFIPDFVSRGEGRILNVSSTASLLPGPLQAVYFATKAYVTSLSNAISEELQGTGVTVSALLPGATETEFAKVAGLEGTDLFSKTASAYSVAKDGYEGMLEGKLNIISGITFFQKLMLATIPFVPKRLLMKQVLRMHQQ